MKPLAIFGVVGGIAGAVLAGETLPVFLADNHGESFAWASRALDLDAEHVLVLGDAHSDASAAERSEEIREGLRRVVSEAERAERVESWRARGRIQAFNWIEPLIPRPFGEVLWVVPAGEPEAMAREAGKQCDGRLEVEPRSAGTMADRWRATDLAGMEAWRPGPRRVVWSLDLDFFAGMEPEVAEAVFERMWVAAMDWPGLEAVCVAVSRPWLASDEEADRLVTLVVSSVSRTRGAVLEIDASVDDRPDDSLRARKGGLVRWDLARAHPVVRARIGALGNRCRVRDRKRTHAPAEMEARVEIEGAQIDLDGVWRLDAGATPVVRLRGVEGSGRVRWYGLKPARDAYDLLPETGLGKGFAEGAGRWIYERRELLTETTDFALAGERWKDVEGRVRLEAEYESGGRWWPGGWVEIRLGQGEGFRRALSECLGMPYVFGIAGVAEGDLSGVETGWGADCSNVLVHAWRRCGVPLRWGDPEGLRRQLRRVEGGLSEADVAQGVMVDFGRHVAALWEDRAPMGRVDPGDLVFHHLGGGPEVVPLADLQEGRPPFQLWALPKGEAKVVRVAGDVVLAGEFETDEGFGKGEADLFLANLESVPTREPATGRATYDFRFPPERLRWLAERGVDGVSMANNHAGDAGPEGLRSALKALGEAGIGCFGAGRNAEEACRPWVREGVACFGVAIVPAMVAGEGPGVASLPEHRRDLEREMAAARARGESIVVLVHGGDEYRTEINEEPRRWARWLVARGAVLVAGSGPHVVQREERHGGAVIAHSLGNAVFPKKLKGADGGRIGEWHLPRPRVDPE